jgi:hypothetical protein
MLRNHFVGNHCVNYNSPASLEVCNYSLLHYLPGDNFRQSTKLVQKITGHLFSPFCTHCIVLSTLLYRLQTYHKMMAGLFSNFGDIHHLYRLFLQFPEVVTLSIFESIPRRRL